MVLLDSKNLCSPTRISTPSFSLQLFYTLKGGQVFRWENFNGGYRGFFDDFPVFLRQNNREIRLRGGRKAQSRLVSYFNLNDPLGEILRSWEGDPVLPQAAASFPGLRLVTQAPWECLLGFILSIVSNIPKIETGLEKLSRYAGKRVLFLGHPLYFLPPAAVLADIPETVLRKFGIGFRARYLRECARKVAAGFSLESLRGLPYAAAKDALRELPGIGDKVADCVLLHGLGHTEAFPVDVWMKRIVEHLYFSGKKKSEGYLSQWGRNRFGPWAGYAELYLYAYGRAILDPRSPFRNAVIMK